MTSHSRSRSRSRRVWIVAAFALAPMTMSAPAAAATTVDRRPTPIAFVGAAAGGVCPTAAQAAGDDAIALARRLAGSRETTFAAEAYLAHLLSVPAPVLAVCDPQAAADAQPIGPIAGTAKVAPWSDGVSPGRRVRGASHITSLAALHPGDRYTLPPVSPSAVVDVAVATAAGARTVRAATPPGTAPQSVAVEGPPTARAVVVTGSGGATARTPVSSPEPLKASVRPAAPRLVGSRLKLRVRATRGAVVVALPTRPYETRRERAYDAAAVIARATGRTTTLTVPDIDAAADEGVDVVVLGLAQRVLSGARCTLSAPRASAAVSCRRDATGPMSVWSARHPSWVEKELRGRFDELVGASVPDLGDNGATVSRAIDELGPLLPVPAARTQVSAAATSIPVAAAPARHAASRATPPTIPASGTSFTSFGGVPPGTFDELVDDGVYGAVQAGDLNGDGRPDLLVGSEVPRLLLSTQTGGLSSVDFDTGGDGGSFGPDLDGDGTTEIVDANGTILLGSRAWAGAPPKSVGAADWDNGGAGELPWAHDEVGYDPVPLRDVNGDGRLELLDVSGNGVDPVYSGIDLAPSSRTRLPVPLAPVGSDLVEPFRDALVARDLLSGARDIADGATTWHEGGSTVRLTTDDGTPGVPDQPGSLLTWQTVDPALPGGLGPSSAPLAISSRPILVDADGPAGDLLIRVAVGPCSVEESRCVRTLRVTRAGAVRASFDVNGYSAATCAFVDDGPDADVDAEVVCGVRSGKLPSRWTDYDDTGTQALAVASSEVTGAQRTRTLPQLTFEGRPLRIAGGFSALRTADGRRHLATLAVSGRGRKATGRFVIVSRLG